jgi:hypothetical protein
MVQRVNGGRYTVDLAGDWRSYAEPLPGYRMLGVFTSSKGINCALAVSDAGDYVAIQGRYITPLVNPKVDHAISAYHSAHGLPGDGQ